MSDAVCKLMDPVLANQNLDPPKEHVLAPGLIPAVLAHLAFGVALAFGVNWNHGDGLTSPFSTRSTATLEANDTARMGSAPMPSAAPALVPAPAPAPVSTVTPVAERYAAPSPPQAAPAPVKPKAPEPRTQVAAVTPSPADERTSPSFDCSKARSPTERLICRDPQLSRMDRELGRVHAQAKRAAPDPADFKRENDEEWRLREAVCRDKDCLLEWYAHRRQQLQGRIAQSR